jgi:hypothetical protein
MKIPELSVEEEKEAIDWRIKKCGWDSFGMLFLKFQQEMKEKIRG